MCVTFFCLRPTSDKNIQLIIGFNRDQQSERPTLPFGPFEEDQYIYAGRDVPTSGTWLGFNIKTGIMAILTNYDLTYNKQGRSRGKVLRKLLNTSFIPEEQVKDCEYVDEKIKEQLNKILVEAQAYKPFNLLVYNIRNQRMFYICTQNKMQEVELVGKEKLYSLCNSDLHTVWPKTEYGLQTFADIVSKLGDKESDEQILSQLNERLMTDRKPFTENPNDESSIFIDPFYSTIESAQRETKETFLAVFRDCGEGKSQITLEQISYANHEAKSVKLKLTI